MRCPRCAGDTMVIDSRVVKHLVVRRRKCTDCKRQFYTQEITIPYDAGLSLMQEHRRKKHEKSR